MATADEEELIAASRCGDTGAFERLVRRHDRSVLRLALAMLRSAEEARDVYQETFLKAQASMGDFRGDCAFRTWLLRIATNLCRDHLRRSAARPAEASPRRDGRVDEQRDDPGSSLERVRDGDPAADPVRFFEAREIGERIEAALRRLPPRERLAFELKHFEGLRMAEIGTMLDSSEETARNCLYRAHQKLRMALADLRTASGAALRVGR